MQSLQVEATKFTEVGFHGRDVDQIMRDLVETSISLCKKKLREEVPSSSPSSPSPSPLSSQVLEKVELAVEELILDGLAGDSGSREMFRQHLRDGKTNIAISISIPIAISIPIIITLTAPITFTIHSARPPRGADSIRRCTCSRA